MMVQSAHYEALAAAVVCATLLLHFRFALSTFSVVVLCSVRGMAQSGATPAKGPCPPDLAQQAQQALHDGSTCYATFGWRVKALIAVAAFFTRGRYPLNRAAISLCLVTGFFRSIKTGPNGGPATSALAWTDEAGEGMRLAFGLQSFSRSLAATFIGSMTDADKSRLFKSYFEIVRTGQR